MNTRISILAIVFGFIALQASAQLKPSREPRSVTDHKTGHTIIMPVAEPIAPVVVTSTKPAGKAKTTAVAAPGRSKNVAHKRDSILTVTRHGYSMDPDSNWGTKARLNDYGKN